MTSAMRLWSQLGSVVGLIATPLTPSHYIGLVRPLATSHALHARVEAVRDEAGKARTLTLRPGRGWLGHRAGQHVRISVPIAGRLVTRTYSIASAPARRDGLIEITVKAQGRASNVIARDITVGTHLPITQALGDFVLPDNKPVRPLFITAGSGITPIMSMLRGLVARGELRDVVHVHYARDAKDVIFGDELRAFAAEHPQYHLHLVHGGERLSSAQLDTLAPDWRSREIWACGPTALLTAITSCADAAGVPLHVERFRAMLAVVPADSAAGGCVSFSASHRRAQADGHTPLLRVAEDAGISAPHGCRMGICHTCEVSLVAGRVRDLRTGATIDEPGARIQVCVCAAVGDVEVAL